MTVALEAYLEPSETSTKQLFCVNNYIIIFARKLHGKVSTGF